MLDSFPLLALSEIFKKNKREFRRIIRHFYETIILPLQQNCDPEELIAAYFGLSDIGCQEDKFYFFDFEAKKQAKQIIGDTYARLIRLYLLKSNQKRLKAAAFADDVILEVKNLQEPVINQDEFNEYLRKRLKTPTLREQLADRDFEKVYQKFKY